MGLDTDQAVELSCRVTQKNLARLVIVLQSGFYLEARDGDVFLDFLVSLPGFTREYIANDVGTVFLNGDAIDDMEIPLSGKSATIALSAAMPGLCGAILKKGSPHAALRKKVVVSKTAVTGQPMHIRIKLFNTIALERGPELFKTGVELHSADLLAFLSLRPSLVEEMQDLTLSGTPISGERLLDHLANHSNIFFKAA
jgi:hypothetical protein